MKKIIGVLIVTLFSIPVAAGINKISGKTKYKVCGGSSYPNYSFVFGSVASSDDRQMALLNAEVNSIRLFRNDTKVLVNDLHEKLISFNDQMKSSKKQYMSLGNSYYSGNSRGDPLVYSKTLKDMEDVSLAQKNSVIVEINNKLNNDIYVLPGKHKPVVLNGITLISMCEGYWQ